MRPDYLFVVPSSSQMYSGTGTAIFDWIKYSRTSFNFSIMMDTGNLDNFCVTQSFCRITDIGFIPSKPFHMPGCIDWGIKDVELHLRSKHFDIIECVSWANAAANSSVLTGISRDQTLIYTPHTQPAWTVANSERYTALKPVFEKMLIRSNAVFLDSEAESELLPAWNLRTYVVPLGVDLHRFENRLQHHSKIILCVCDCREHRKRVDLLLAAFKIARRIDPDLRLVLAGKGSDNLEIEPDVSVAVSTLGYVSAEKVVELYNYAGIFALMSDFEAFGLPIAEALCCGCAVLLNRQAMLMSIFSSMPGVHWTENTDGRQTAEAMIRLATMSIDSKEISDAAMGEFGFDKTYGLKMAILNGILAHKAAARQ